MIINIRLRRQYNVEFLVKRDKTLELFKCEQELEEYEVPTAVDGIWLSVFIAESLALIVSVILLVVKRKRFS
ncbi:MAG: hypothetical protein J6R44_03990 [Clostridia bacterium]|nr:hypothetical protein [Clostridia bacterium]